MARAAPSFALGRLLQNGPHITLASQTQQPVVLNTEPVAQKRMLTYVTCDDVELAFWLLQHLASLAHKVQVAGSMEAILANCILLVYIYI